MTKQLNMVQSLLKSGLNNFTSIPVCIIAVGSVFKKYNNYYPQGHLHECLYKFLNESERVFNFCTIYTAA